MRRLLVPATALWLVAGFVTLPLLGSCGADVPDGVSAEQATQVSLLALEPTSVDVPGDSRDGEAPAAAMSLNGKWTYKGTTKGGMHQWVHAVPIRPRGLFFHGAQPGMSLTNRGGASLEYGRFGSTPHPTWSYNKKSLIVYRPAKGNAPTPGDYTFHYQLAADRENAMNFAWSGAAIKADFVRTEVHQDWDTRRGVLLPAPATIRWSVTVPMAGELSMDVGLVLPEVASGKSSDGAILVVNIADAGQAQEVARHRLSTGGVFSPLQVDLSQWQGKTVELTISTEPGASNRFDYAFLGEPVLASRKANPKRVVLVFIDTLRPDHMSLFGYERDTTAGIDGWAKGAAVFENARSVAPWTLPSARTVLTGRHPEYYESTETLQHHLAERGWKSAMFAGNVYLSTNFGMARDWGLHRVGMWPKAEVVTNDAIAWLEANEGHDAIVQVHYMDPHLPHVEPAAYRFLYAGEAKGGLREEFHLSDVRRLNQVDQPTQEYIKDRYDNNVRYATDQIARLLEHVGPDDIVVLYADHGEEFWDHTGFEHGHTLFDELLRVPLVIKAPGIRGTRSDAPASLLDITPTVLDALGIEPSGAVDGLSLMPAARGEGDADLRSRGLAFGRPLYGSERWGVLTPEAKKWTTQEGREAMYDIGVDPGETDNLIRNKPGAAGQPYREAFAEALGTRLGLGYRIMGSNNRGGRPTQDMHAIVQVPGGLDDAWVEHDPLKRSNATIEKGESMVNITWHKGYAGAATVWVIPKLPVEEVTHALEVTAWVGDVKKQEKVAPEKPAGLEAFRTPLMVIPFKSRNVRLTHGITAMPQADMKAVNGADDEMRSALEALGYIDPDDQKEQDKALEKEGAE
jgi:arylsulfatase A-like enzyme